MIRAIGALGLLAATLAEAQGPVRIQTGANLPGGNVGVPYSATLTGRGGSPPYLWSFAGGDVPPGLRMDTRAGEISGTPSQAGTFRFTVGISDSMGGSDSRGVMIVISGTAPAPPPALVLMTTGALAGATVGTGYSASFSAAGGQPPYSWSIGGGNAPPGLAMDSAGGVLSGTPTAAGTYGFQVRVTDANATTVTSSVSITVVAPLSVGTGSLPPGVVTQAYNASLGASGGVSPYSWSVSAGALPNGLAMNGAGQINGTPTARGNFGFTAQVSDSAGKTATRQLAISVTAPALTMGAGSLPSGTVGVPYSAGVSASGGVPPMRFAVSGGSLPQGLMLDANTGQISGSPSTAGSYSLTVQVTDSATQTVTQSYVLAVSPGVSITSGDPPSGTVGVSYSASLGATGGTPPYTWSVVGGSLPAGIGLSAGGQLSGTPTAAGTSRFTVRATDSTGSFATQPLGITIGAGVSVGSGALGSGVAGTAYTGSLSASGGTPPYTWSITQGSLPDGLSLDTSTGQITGTPTTAGAFSFTAQARDANGAVGSGAFSITIAAGVSIRTGSLGSGIVGAAYSASISASGGTGPYTWSLAGGSLPSGLSLDSSTGQIAGTPTTAGTFAFSVQVRDANGATASAALSITIAAQLSITTSSLGNGVAGVAYSASLSAAGGTGAYTWSVGGGSLAAGLSLDTASGQISGTPASAGTFAFTAQVRDANDATASKQLSIVVSSALSVTSSGSLSGGVVGTAYSASLSAAGGTGPYTWSIAGGSLPGGVSLDAATGAITGTPTAAGTFSFSAQVRDANGATASGSLSITIGAQLSITTGSVGSGVAGVAYAASLSAAGGTGSYTWSVGGGSLPAGLSLDAGTGQISGTPTAAGTFGFTAQVRDSSGATASRQFSITISAALTVTSSGSLSPAVVGTTYSASVAAAGGTGPYAWSVTGGSLPAGLTLDAATGQISGTPTAAGNAAFTVQVRDAAGATASAQVSIAVTAALTVSGGAMLANGVVGTAYSASLSAAGGTGPYTWSVAAGSLPDGLSLTSGGQITGTPSAAGTFTFTAQARDASGATASGQFSITVGASLTVTTGSTGNGVVGTAYSASLAAAGGTGPYTWSVSGGALPDGLTLAASGQISGTPTAAGTFGFTVQARDASGATATKQLSITVVGKLSITASSLPNAVVGSPYSASLGAAGGAMPYAWSIASGSLPAGLSMSGAGQIAGTPTSAGSYPITVRVTDASNQSAEAALTLTVGAGLAVTGCPTASLTAGQAYNSTLSAAGGTPPYRWDISGGQLPAGLSLSSGQIAGTPTAAGTGEVIFRVTDAASATATRACPFTVIDTLTVSSGQLAAGAVGQAYSQTLNASGGTSPYSWTVSGGSVPPGLSVNASGQIAGTPTTAGQYTFTVRVGDSKGLSAEKSVSIAIRSGVVINGCPAAGATVGQPYSSTVTAGGGTPPYRWTISAGALPGGLSINGISGAITGTPVAAGPFQFTLAVNDAATGAATQSCTIAVRAPLTISGSLPGTGVGATYQASLSASGGTAPYSWSVVGGSLPTGLSLASKGQVTGVATAPGQFTVTVRVTDSTGAAADQQFSIAVSAGLTVAACPASTGTVGAAYSSLLAANGGRPPLTWSIETGQIPTGVALSAGGAMTGVPTAAGNFPFTLRVSDAAGTVATRACAVAINPALTIVTGRLADAAVRVRYNETLTASGGLPPYTWTLVGGALPPGLLLNASGVVSGAPVELGRYNFTIGVTDSAGNYKEAGFSINVNAGLTVPECPQATAVVGRRYSSVLSAIGGQSPYAWTVLGGSIPPGLALAPATGTITGVPSQPGSFGFTAQASDAAGTTAQRLCNVEVFPELRINTTSAPDAVVGSNYANDVQVAGGVAPYTWTVSGGTLPAGITLSAATGRLTGQPSQEGSARFTVMVTDALGGTAERELTITVRTAFAVAACPSPGATAGQPYFATLSAVGGQSPYRWSVATGALPAGLTLTGSTLEGTPVSPGAAEFTLSATDAGSATATRGCAIQVSAPALSILSPAALPGTQVAADYAVTLEATGGRGPYQWSIADGALPEGITLSVEGVLTGNPNQAGVFRATLRVVDQDGVGVEETFRLEVRPLDPPRLTISGLPATTRAAQQPILRISLVEPHPVPVRGTVTLEFTPESDMPVDDPAIQFSSGGRQVDFIIPANEMEAQVPGSLLAIQTGTVAGRIHVSAVAQSEGGAEGAVLAETNAQVQRTPPRITNARAVRNANGLAIQITGYTTSRTITLGKFRFTGRAGSNLPTAEIPVDMTAAAQAWFASDVSARFGSQFQLNQPFQIQGDVSAIESVTVTLSNGDGDSNEVTAVLTTP